MIALALAGALLLAPQADTLPAAAIRGQVRGAVDDGPLVGAVVELRSAGEVRSVIADSGGFYRFTRVPPGRGTLRASRADHEPLEVTVLVPAGAEVMLDLTLQPRPVTLGAVVVHGRPLRPAPDSLGSPESTPTPALAAAAALQGLPGAAVLAGSKGGGGDGSGAEPPDPSDVLYVRGLSSEQKLVLLDGAPVYAPFHLGGLLAPFEPGVLRSATMYLAGAPARYDGGLSYILDLTTRPGNDERVASSGSVDLLSARSILEGPLPGGATFLLSGRAVHALGLGPFLDGHFPYAYREGLARVDVPVGPGTLGVTGFANREAVRFDSLVATNGAASWRNAAVSLRWRGPMLGSRARLTAALSDFSSALPALQQPAAWGSARRVRLAGDFERGPKQSRLRYGASFEQIRKRTATGSGEMVAAASSGGAYVEGDWQLSDEVRLRGGVRADVFSASPSPRLAPRLSLTWALSDQAALTGAVGAVHQYVGVPEPLAAPGSSAAAEPFFADGAFAVGRATHATLTLGQRFEHGFRLRVEGFFKDFAEVPAASLPRTEASGLEMEVHRDAGPVRGWLGYSLTWLWSLPSSGSYTERFTGRNLVNAGVRTSLGRWLDIDARLAFGSGLPYTAIPLSAADAVNSPVQLASIEREPLAATPSAEPYLRLDLGLSRTFTARWGTRAMTVAPYLRVLNALDRRDALFYRYRRDDGSTRPLNALPLLPTVGVEWSF